MVMDNDGNFVQGPRLTPSLSPANPTLPCGRVRVLVCTVHFRCAGKLPKLLWIENGFSKRVTVISCRVMWGSTYALRDVTFNAGKNKCYIS